MIDSGVLPDCGAFVAAFKACSGLAGAETGKDINGQLVKVSSLEKTMTLHSEALRRFPLDVYVGSSLVNLDSRCGSMLDASRVFHALPSRNVVTWTVLLLGYVTNGEAETSLELFVYLRNSSEAEPDEFTYSAAIQACSKLAEEGAEPAVKYKSLERGMSLHSEVERSPNLRLDDYLASSLVDMYVKCGTMLDARRLFEQQTPRLERNVVAWTGLVLGYTDKGVPRCSG